MNDRAIDLLEKLIKLAKHSKTVEVLNHILTIMKLYKETQDD